MIPSLNSSPEMDFLALCRHFYAHYPGEDVRDQVIAEMGHDGVEQATVLKAIAAVDAAFEAGTPAAIAFPQVEVKA